MSLCILPSVDVFPALIFDDDVFDVFEDIGRCPEPFHDPAEEEAMSDLFEEVRDDGIKLTLSLNVSAFKPEELSVNLNEGTLTIEGKQEIKEDDSYSMRSFTRQWNSPRTSTSTRFTPPSLKTAASSLRPRTSQSQWNVFQTGCDGHSGVSMWSILEPRLGTDDIYSVFTIRIYSSLHEKKRPSMTTIAEEVMVFIPPSPPNGACFSSFSPLCSFARKAFTPVGYLWQLNAFRTNYQLLNRIIRLSGND